MRNLAIEMNEMFREQELKFTATPCDFGINVGKQDDEYAYGDPAIYGALYDAKGFVGQVRVYITCGVDWRDVKKIFEVIEYAAEEANFAFEGHA